MQRTLRNTLIFANDFLKFAKEIIRAHSLFLHLCVLIYLTLVYITLGTLSFEDYGGIANGVVESSKWNAFIFLLILFSLFWLQKVTKGKIRMLEEAVFYVSCLFIFLFFPIAYMSFDIYTTEKILILYLFFAMSILFLPFSFGGKRVSKHV